MLIVFFVAIGLFLLLLSRRGTTRVRRYDDGIRRSPIGGRTRF